MQDDSATTVSLTQIIDEAPLSAAHWRIWFLSAMGLFLDGFDFFIIGVAMPLIVKDLTPSPEMQGLIGAAAILGAMVGAVLLGRLTDRWGRKYLFLVDLSIFIVFAVLCGLAWSVWSLVAFRFLLGVGVGADYPICASYVTEFMPTRYRGRMLIGAFGFQALGMVAAALTGLVILEVFPVQEAWRHMLVAGAIPAGLILVLRVSVPESPRWSLRKGRVEEALQVVKELVPSRENDLEAAARVERGRPVASEHHGSGYPALLGSRFRNRTILATVPWFLMDIATYGVGLFIPLILASFAAKGGSVVSVHAEFTAIEGAAFLDVFLVMGIALNIALVDRWGRIKLQILGFAGMAGGLVLLVIATMLPGGSSAHLILVFSGFIMFNVLMNMGPNATTFLLPAELYPTEMRATGHGFAASTAKFGAAIGTFCLPIFKDSVGIPVTLGIVALISLLALAVTVIYRIETRGQCLDAPEE